MLGMFGAYFCLDIILGSPEWKRSQQGRLTVLYLGIAMLFAMRSPEAPPSARRRWPTVPCAGATRGR